jgi:xanthine dehydrogenase iron-sulfur cluster and FAD-binding subunit A
MAAEALVGDGELGRDEIIEALSGHVCRCTGYAKILDAVGAASRGEVSSTTAGELEPAVPGATGPEDGTAVKGSPA